MSSNSAQVEDDYFNDLSRQPDLRTTVNKKPSPNSDSATAQAGQIKQKRVACVICRKRKLKCDGERPSCGTCSRLNHNCAYDEVRRKSGPKRGYVKELEARLAQVETQLKRDNASPPAAATSNQPPIPATNSQSTASYTAFETGAMNIDLAMPMDGLLSTTTTNTNTFDASPSVNIVPDIDLAIDENFSWEMIGLGLEEPLPTQDAIDELTSTYFEKIHPSCPVIHKYRYFAGMNLSPHMRPAVCLRYAMWANAASISDKYAPHQDILYRRARKYAEYDEMRGQGQDCVTVAHCQTWSLVAMYEFKSMYFPRAWMSVARAARLALMMGFNRMDGAGIEVKQCLPPPKDWTEREERRRAFWMAYCSDRFASVGTGWPMIVDERDIMSNLPASEQAYQSSTAENTQSLSASMSPQGASSISSFAGVIFMAHFFGKNLHHLHRGGPDDREDDIHGVFWKRHRQLDNVLLHKSLSLPSHLRLPNAIRDPNAIFINMAIHTSTICLHQAAIFKAEKHNLPISVVEQSRDRCTLAATEITNILKLVSHLDTSSMNPYLPFCLYVAARVFVQFLKAKAEDTDTRLSLNFLLAALEWLKVKNPLSESFLVQLSLDIQGSGLDNALHNAEMPTRLKESFKCGVLNAGGWPNTLSGVANKSTLQHGAPGLPDNTAFFSEKAAERLSTPGSHETPLQYLFSPLEPEASKSLYAQMHTFDVPSGESRRPPNSAQSQENDTVTAFKGPGGLFHGGWKVDSPEAHCADTEQPTPPSNHTPTGLTPSESHNASSATSYSPRQEEARGTINSNQNAKGSGVFTFPETTLGPNFSHQSTVSSVNDSSNSSFQMPPTPISNGDSFTIPPGWDFGTGNASMPTGTTPFSGNTPLPSGMSPPTDGDWTQMMNGMSWSAAGPPGGDMSWPTAVGASPAAYYKSGFLYETGDNERVSGRGN